MIEQLSDAGKTIVLATHDLHARDRLADRSLVFSEDRRIVADGSPGEILARRNLLIDVNLIDEDTDLHTRSAPAAAQKTPAVLTETQWSGPDVTYAACDRTIVNAVRTLPGIDAVDIEAKTVGFRYDEMLVSEQGVRAAIEAAGYPVRDMSERDASSHRKRRKSRAEARGVRLRPEPRKLVAHLWHESLFAQH